MFAEEDEEDDGKLDDEVRTFKLIVHTINTYQLVFQFVGAFLATIVQINMFSYSNHIWNFHLLSSIELCSAVVFRYFVLHGIQPRHLWSR